MAFTVWAAFNQFRSATVDLDAAQSTRARASRDYLYQQLIWLDNNNATFPLTNKTFSAYGSFARRTKIRPLDDIDVLVELNGRGTTDHSSTSNSYVAWLRITDSSAPLARFPDAYGYVNSTRVLNAVKSPLSSLTAYSKAEVNRNGQAVSLNLSSYPWKFDVVPAVPIANTMGTTVYYLIPNVNGDWIRTDPRVDQSQITSTNLRQNGLFLGSMRLLKYWNRRTHKPRLMPYYFETLGRMVFDSGPVFTGYPEAAAYFFKNCGGFFGYLPRS